MEKLYIRTDANHTLGVGHVMRCCTIAEEWIRRGGDVCFVVSDPESAVVVEEKGYDVYRLMTAKWDDLEQELTELADWMESENARLFLVDSYYITHHYMEALYQRLTLIYIGKFQEEAFPAHMVIDYTISVMEDAGAYERYDQINAKKLLGCRFFPLRREFTEDREKYEMEADPRKRWREGRKRLSNVLILTGGSDPFHIAWKLGSYLAGRYRLHIVVGKFCTDRDRLEELATRYQNTFFVYQNVMRLSKLMRRCDLAVSAGGITLYELCSCGLPTVAYIFADNQREAVGVFARQKIMLSAGDIREGEEETWMEQVEKHLDTLVRNEEEYTAMREKMLRLVDGRGTGRIVEAIADY